MIQNGAVKNDLRVLHLILTLRFDLSELSRVSGTSMCQTLQLICLRSHHLDCRVKCEEDKEDGSRNTDVYQRICAQDALTQRCSFQRCGQMKRKLCSWTSAYPITFLLSPAHWGHISVGQSGCQMKVLQVFILPSFQKCRVLSAPPLAFQSPVLLHLFSGWRTSNFK